MLKEWTDKITHAVKDVYEETDIYDPMGSIAVKSVTITVPSSFPEIQETREMIIGVTRSTVENDLYYKLYIPSFDENNPFIKVFGCWPQDWVVDVFVRVLQHYNDLYE